MKIKLPKIIITKNDFYRFAGVLLVASGYFIDKEKPLSATIYNISFQGETVAILGIILIFVPLFLRNKNDSGN